MLRYVLLCAFFFIALVGFSQEDLLKRRVSLSIHKQSLENTLMTLSNSADFTFSYDATIFKEKEPVSIFAREESLKHTLDQILPQNVVYKVSGNHLILLRKLEEQKKEKFIVSGNVFNAETGKPLENIVVYEVSSLVSSMTDAQGAFKMSVPVQYDRFGIAFNKKNIRDTVIVITPKNHHLSISLWSLKEAVQVKSIDISPPGPAVESLNLVQRLVPDESLVRTQNSNIILHRKAQISLIPNVGSNLKMSGLMQNSYSMNVFIGYANGVEVFEMGGLFNINRHRVKGVQVGGLGNITGGATHAVQVSGVFNHNKAAVHGVQVGGVYNVAADSLKGTQIGGVSNNVWSEMMGWQVAGVSNWVTSRAHGGQISGILNVVKEKMTGTQIAGVLNRAKDVEGLQLSGVANWAHGEITGLQFGGVLNIANSFKTGQVSTVANIAIDSASGTQVGALFNYAKEIKGIQVAAIVNYAKHIHGIQIGLINWADSTSGIPVGFISIIKKGGIHQFEAYTNEIIPFNVGFRTGVRKLYNIFTAGYGSWSGAHRWAFGYGMGTQRNISQRTFINIEYTASWVNERKGFTHDLSLLNRLDINLGYGKPKGVKIIVGPSLNIWLSEWMDKQTGEFLSEIAPYTISENVRATTLMQFWVGGKLTLRL